MIYFLVSVLSVDISACIPTQLLEQLIYCFLHHSSLGPAAEQQQTKSGSKQARVL